MKTTGFVGTALSETEHRTQLRRAVVASTIGTSTPPSGAARGSRYLSSRKKARMSAASAAGSSRAAKWPPEGMYVQRRRL